MDLIRQNIRAEKESRKVIWNIARSMCANAKVVYNRRELAINIPFMSPKTFTNYPELWCQM